MLLAVALIAAMASAQSPSQAPAVAWTVQTVALRDLRQADTVVAQLKNLGFDAYDEFAMHDGKQFVRVRVGCYTDRAAAQAVADALAKHVTEQAVVATLSSQAKVDRCVREDIGFLKPAEWTRVQASNGLPTFHVRLAGKGADLVYDGTRWVVVQDGSARPTAAALTGPAFIAAHPGGVPWVAQEMPSGTHMLCPGKLVGHAGEAAIVERAGEVVACRFAPLPASLAKGGSP
ncbi:MAG: SPOR domain-containing protein [Deinococcales bacterium]